MPSKDEKYFPAVAQTVLSVIGPIVLVVSILICKQIRQVPFSILFQKDISRLGKQCNKSKFEITEPSQLMFIICFVSIAILIVLGGCARCTTVIKLFKLYDVSKTRYKYVQLSNTLFTLASGLLMSMSWTPCNKTIGHFISAALGIGLIIIAQIIDAFNWFIIYNLVSKSSKSFISRKSRIQAVLLFAFPISALLCFIAWKPLYLSSIFEWFGVLFIYLSFMVYGTQAIEIHSLIYIKSKNSVHSIDSNTRNPTVTIDNNIGVDGDMWTICKSASSTGFDSNKSHTSSPQ
eukprot:60605_1